MKFLYPQFLWALGVLSIPLLIHLFNFRRYTTVYFSNTRFLQNVVKQSKAINRLKQLLIMATRMLAFAMLVLAFANPYLPATNSAASQSGWATIYLDNSPSMQSGEGVNSSLNLGRTKAVEIIKALPENYKVQVLTNDFSGKQQRFYSKGEAINLIDETEISYSGRSAQSVVERIEQAQQNVNSENLELFWISDFQASAFAEKITWPQAWTKTVMPLSHTKDLGNASIDSVWFEQPVLQPGFDQELFVQLRNSGATAAKKVALSISLEGEQLSTKEIEIPAKGDVTTSFVLRPMEAKAYQGSVKIEANDPAFDNVFHFAYDVEKPFRILLTGSDSRLSKFQRLYSDSIYELTYRPADAIDYASIPGFDLFIIDAPQSLPSGLVQALKEETSLGKNTVLFPAKENSTANNLLVNFGVSALGNPQEASKVLNVSWDDPIFKNVFSARPSNPALPSAEQNFAYPSSQGYPLLQLSNGSPLMSRLVVGSGNLILSTANLEKTNLSNQPLFVPIMLNAALFSRNVGELYSVSGKSKGPSFESQTDKEVPMSIAVGEQNVIPRQREKNGRIEIFDLSSSFKPGIYPVSQAEKSVGYLALNTTPEESIWNFYSEEEIQNTFGLQSSDVLEASAGDIDYTLKQRYEGTPLWKLFLAAAILFLLVEIVIIKLWK